MSTERVVYVVLVGASVLLGLWFVVALGRPWRSELPSIAWLQTIVVSVAVAFDLVVLLALFGVATPAWGVALVLASQDAAFSYRLFRLRLARREDRRAAEQSELEESR